MRANRGNMTMMVGRTRAGDPVWSTNGGKPFLLPDGDEMAPVKWWWWPWSYRRMPEPHLSWMQVAAANEKSKKVLKALRKGPIYIDRGFLKGQDGRIITTRAITRVMLHWMEGNGFVFTRQKLSDGRVRVDIDIETTRKNKVM